MTISKKYGTALKQINIYSILYSNDYNDMILPCAADRIGATDAWYFKIRDLYMPKNVVENYLQVNKFFQCPSDENSVTHSWAPVVTSSYGYSWILGDVLQAFTHSGTTRWKAKKLSFFRTPSAVGRLVELKVSRIKAANTSLHWRWQLWDIPPNYQVNFVHNKKLRQDIWMEAAGLSGIRNWSEMKKGFSENRS